MAESNGSLTPVGYNHLQLLAAIHTPKRLKATEGFSLGDLLLRTFVLESDHPMFSPPSD